MSLEKSEDCLGDSASISSWWAEKQTKLHPIEKASNSTFSTVLLWPYATKDEKYVVENILYMLEGLENELFSLQSNARHEKKFVEDETIDALVSKQFMNSFTWTLNFDIQLPSLIPNSLYSLLSHFLNLSSCIQKLREVIKVISFDHGFTNRAFALSLREYIHLFELQIQYLEKHHRSHPITLIQLQQSIQGYEYQFEFLSRLTFKILLPLSNIDYSSHVDDLYPEKPKPSKAERAAHMFNRLFDAMQSIEEDDKNLRLKMWIFLNCLKQYIEKLEKWIYHGYLAHQDRDEFCIIQSANENVTSNLFWDYKYSLTEAEMPTFLKDFARQILATGKSTIILNHIQQNKQLRCDERSNHKNLRNETIENKIYDKILKKICQHFEIEDPSYNQTLVEKIGRQNEVAKEKSLFVPEDEFELFGVKSNSSFFELSGSENPNQFEDDASYMAWPSSDSEEDENTTEIAIDSASSANKLDYSKLSSTGANIGQILKQIIIEPLEEEYTKVNQKLQNILFEDCLLLDHLQVIQSFFFQKHPAVIDFYTLKLFPSLWSYQEVSEVTLNYWLKQNIGSSSSWLPNDQNKSNHQQLLENNISIHIVLPKRLPIDDKTTSKASKENKTESDLETKQSIDSTKEYVNDDIKVSSIKNLEDTRFLWFEYEIDWPISLLVNNQTLELYNSISCFLTSIWRSEYVLEQLTTIHKKGSMKSGFDKPLQIEHKMHLFRNELLNFVTQIRSYMISRVSQTSFEEFRDDLASGRDLDEMQQIHVKFLTNIRDRCLLSDKFSVIKKAIDRLLDIAILFATQYQVLHGSITNSKFSREASVWSSMSSNQSNTNQTYDSDQYSAIGNQRSAVLAAGSGVDSKSQSRLTNLFDKLRAEFIKVHGFLLTILSKMQANTSGVHLADLLLRINFSEFYFADQ